MVPSLDVVVSTLSPLLAALAVYAFSLPERGGSLHRIPASERRATADSGFFFSGHDEAPVRMRHRGSEVVRLGLSAAYWQLSHCSRSIGSTGTA